MKTVTSKDGTSIAYDQTIKRPAVILVSGAMGVRTHPITAELAERLSTYFTVINYDRRGKGDSEDGGSYAVAYEVDDIEALIDAVGGTAHLYGISSGAVLALEATKKLPNKVKKLAMYEPPFIVDDSRPPVPADYVARLKSLTAADRRGDAVELFMTGVIGIPGEFVAQMRGGALEDDGSDEMKPPEWAEMEKVAHTLAYDGEIMGDTMSGKPLPKERWAGIKTPTLVITGGESDPFFHSGAQALVEILPNARHRFLEGQQHNVSPAALAPMLVEYFNT